MTANPFATPATTTLAASPDGSPTPPDDDLDFSADVPAMMPGLWDAHVCGLKKHEGKLLIEFMVDEGPKGTKVTFWADPSDQQAMIKLEGVCVALGEELVNIGGDLKPACGWKGLKGKPCRVALNVYNGAYQIPRFGKFDKATCPAEYEGRDFGCGVFPVGAV